MKMLLLTITVFILGCTNLSKNIEETTRKNQSDALIEEIEYTKRAPKDSIGLALSGGGVRSASFNIGVLGGLANSGILDEVDYISSVSGGSYAAYWYYTKLKWNMDERDNFFKIKYPWKEETNDNDEAYRFQKYLEQNMKLGRYSRKTLDNPFDGLKTLGAVTWRFLYAVPFAVVDMTQLSRMIGNNYSPVPSYFRNSIERIYGFLQEK